MKEEFKEYNEDAKFLEKLEKKYILSGCYCTGTICDMVEFRLIKSKIFFKWENLSMTIAIFKEERSIMLEAYSRWMWIGEWGGEFKKPIIFMEIISENLNYKFKEILSVEKIFEITENFEIFNLRIYFETIIGEDPKESDYKEGNNMWIFYVGGMYDIIDPCFWLESTEGGEWTIVEEASVTETNSIWFRKLCEETADTAIEMRKNGVCKWWAFADPDLKFSEKDAKFI